MELSDLFHDFSDNVGGYWSNSNKEFDSTNPTFLDRTIRTINPITGFGSTLGSMYDYANNGDKLGMALTALSAIPAFAYTKSVPKNIYGDTAQLDKLRLLLGYGTQIGTNEIEYKYSTMK